MERQGKYPVIFISLKDVVGSYVEEIKDKLKGLISTTYESHSYLANSSKILGSEKLKFQRYINQDYTGITIEESIKFLSTLLHKHHGQRVYVLVDEYDKPVNSLLEKYLGQGKSSEKVSLIQDVTKLISYTVCSSVSKTNPALEKLIMTGIFDTTQKESGSGCNNISVYGIADIKFSKSFGFSKVETDALISKLKFENAEEISINIKSWYNGYYVPISTEENLALYTPWAVMKFLNTAYTDHDYTPQNYWSKSGASTILQQLFTKEKCIESDLSKKLLTIAESGIYDVKFDFRISLFNYDWFDDTDNSKFFSYLLLNAGYLTLAQNTHINKHDALIKLRIPNEELTEEFQNIIPNEGEVCSKILKNLAKDKCLDIVQKIISNNDEEIKKSLSSFKKIDCECSAVNLNYLEIAALVGNKKTFSLLSEKCDSTLLSTKHIKHEITPHCFAKLSNNTEVLSTSFIDQPSECMDIPNAIQSFYCGYIYGIPSAITSGAIGAAIPAIINIGAFDWPHNQNPQIPPGQLNLARILPLIFWGGVVKPSVDFISYLADFCKTTNEYRSIDISNPKKFISLLQFEKYTVEHPSAYVMFNRPCNKDDIKLKELGLSIADNYQLEQKLEFILCDTKAQDNTDL